jgi:hypothetical protein
MLPLYLCYNTPDFVMGNLAALLHTFSFFFAPPFVPNIVEPPVAPSRNRACGKH